MFYIHNYFYNCVFFCPTCLMWFSGFTGYGGFDNFNGFNNYCFGNGAYEERMRGARGRGGMGGHGYGSEELGSGFHSGHFVHMRGLPFRATESDIAHVSSLFISSALVRMSVTTKSILITNTVPYVSVLRPDTPGTRAH